VAAVEALRPLLAGAGSALVVPVRVTIGFPSRGALAVKRRRIGECWATSASANGTAEVLITPLLDDPLEVVAVLAHELGHAALGHKVGHRKPFARLMAKLGLEGPATATVPGDAFRTWATPVLRALGPLPHARLSALVKEGKRKPDSCRQLKVTCPTCGYLCRVTKKWLADAGAPLCPTDGVALEEEETEP
jgi:Peptidase family M48